MKTPVNQSVLKVSTKMPTCTILAVPIPFRDYTGKASALTTTGAHVFCHLLASPAFDNITSLYCTGPKKNNTCAKPSACVAVFVLLEVYHLGFALQPRLHRVVYFTVRNHGWQFSDNTVINMFFTIPSEILFLTS